MKIIGHTTQRQFLRRLAEGRKIPQAMLFCGEDSLGKKTIAFEFIKLLQGGKSYTPDLVFIKPETKEIHIDQVRELQKELSFRPQFSVFKSVIIDEAHSLNAQAQNCLLKTIEEPKGKALFILVTAFPEMLFDTIRSRCEPLKFYPLSQDEMAKHFPPEIVSLSEGRPGIAFNFLRKPEVLRQETEARQQLEQLLQKSLIEKFAFVESFVKENNPQALKQFLERLVRYFRNLFLQNFEDWHHLTPLDRTRKLAHLTALKEKIETVEELKFLQDTTNVNQRLLLEILMLDI